jgi:mannose-6-phosphate isomerase
MKTVSVLENTIQEYAWGSTTAISDLLGIHSDPGKPMAELWMGAHPKAPSMVKAGSNHIPLTSLIEDDPENILGKMASKKFDKKLPFLLKVLAAAQPLSIQAHPSLKQAQEGFAKENDMGIPLNAPHRNYKDGNHKPECICALTPFWALNGFRKIPDIISLMSCICSDGMKNILEDLKSAPDAGGLKIFFKALMTMDDQIKSRAISHGIESAEKLQDSNPAFGWILKLQKKYPEDIGIFSPVILNLIRLEPGQAMFLPAGELHAYLDGLGIELMANSDNVLRGGLTPKHVDVPELLKVLNFKERDIDILLPVKSGECEKVYQSHAKEFVLSIISVENNMIYTGASNRSAEILLCTHGKATITDIVRKETIELKRGVSVIIPASVDSYQIKGDATIYKAAVPF